MRSPRSRVLRWGLSSPACTTRNVPSRVFWRQEKTNMNHVDPPSFAERLMKSESGNDELRRRYEEDKLALMERRLTPWHRRIGWLGLPVYGVLIIGGGYLLLMANPALPREWVVLDAVT